MMPIYFATVALEIATKRKRKSKIKAYTLTLELESNDVEIVSCILFFFRVWYFSNIVNYSTFLRFNQNSTGHIR